MGLFSADLKQLALAAVIKTATQGGLRNPAIPGLVFLSVALCITAVGFIIAGTYSILYTYYPPATAQLYMGCMIFAAALVSYLSSHLIMRVRQKKMKSHQKMLLENIHQTFDALTAELENPIRENPKTAAILAGLAGYAAGQQLH